MPYYNCTFVNDSGAYNKRLIFAENKKELLNSLLNTDEKLLYARRDFFKNPNITKILSRKIGYFDFVLFNQKMITLLKSGVTFIRALDIIVANLKKGNMREILAKCQSDIKNGIQISDAFSSPSIPFKKIYQASLLAGERSGQLPSILVRFNSYLEKIANLRRKVISSMTYPVILFLFMISLVLIILVYAMPKFASFYDDFEAELPLATYYLISFSEALKDNIVFIGLFIALVIIAVKIIERRFQHIIIIDYIKIRIPVIGKIIIENAMTVFTRTLAILIAGGIPVPESTQIAVETFNNKYFLYQVREVPQKIREGKLLSDVLVEVDFVPPVLVEVIRVGESSGNLVDVLNENADSFENSIDAKISSLISLIEPVLIVVLGLVIAFMLVSIYLPIFNTVNVVR
ncbi:MAG: type II secretion system F family protein [Candidatus Aminicenantes bacterium]|nr:type II secretion system F family protein [Candidatus Aminicenantes bacterium]